MIFCQEFKSIIDLLTHNGTVLISTRDTILYVRQNNFMSDDFLLNLFVIIKEDAYLHFYNRLKCLFPECHADYNRLGFVKSTQTEIV